MYVAYSVGRTPQRRSRSFSSIVDKDEKVVDVRYWFAISYLHDKNISTTFKVLEPI